MAVKEPCEVCGYTVARGIEDHVCKDESTCEVCAHMRMNGLVKHVHVRVFQIACAFFDPRVGRCEEVAVVRVDAGALGSQPCCSKHSVGRTVVA